MNATARSVLADLAARLDTAGVPFALGGSGLLWALGLVGDVGDLDVMLPADAERAALAALGLENAAVDRVGTQMYASTWFVATERGGVGVDLIGGMALRADGHVVALPWATAGHVEVDGVSVPLCDPALWWVVYRRIDPAKAAALEGVVAPQRLERTRLQLELGPEW